MSYSVKKLLSIRLFDDAAGKRWQKNVKETELELLCVSQFTLYNRLKGNKPDFHLAMQGPEASTLYNQLLEKMGQQYTPDRIKGDTTFDRFKFYGSVFENRKYLPGKPVVVLYIEISDAKLYSVRFVLLFRNIFAKK